MLLFLFYVDVHDVRDGCLRAVSPSGISQATLRMSSPIWPPQACHLLSGLDSSGWEERAVLPHMQLRKRGCPTLPSNPESNKPGSPVVITHPLQCFPLRPLPLVPRTTSCSQHRRADKCVLKHTKGRHSPLTLMWQRDSAEPRKQCPLNRCQGFCLLCILPQSMPDWVSE